MVSNSPTGREPVPDGIFGNDTARTAPRWSFQERQPLTRDVPRRSSGNRDDKAMEDLVDSWEQNSRGKVRDRELEKDERTKDPAKEEHEK